VLRLVQRLHHPGEGQGCRRVRESLTGVVAVRGSLGDGNFCAIVTSGGVDCWGYGQNGELGNRLASDSDVPVAAAFP
jgi:hypothetical protein